MAGHVILAPSGTYVADLRRTRAELTMFEYVAQGSPVSVYYAAILPILAHVYPRVKFVRINADNLKRFVEIERCVTFPSYILWKNGGCVGSFITENELGGTEHYKVQRDNVGRALEMLVLQHA